MKMLVVENDQFNIEVLEKALAKQHYLVDWAMDGQFGCRLAETYNYDLALVNWELPLLNGLLFCQRLRTQGNLVPIILMTANLLVAGKNSKVLALDGGADDCILKPLDMPELLARIRSLWRRSNFAQSHVLEWEGLKLDLRSCRVSFCNQPLLLTAKEYALLALFLRNGHQIFSNESLLDQIWCSDDVPSANTVRSHIRGLRHKLKQVGAGDLIETVHGLGYRLRVQEDAKQPIAIKVTQVA